MSSLPIRSLVVMSLISLAACGGGGGGGGNGANTSFTIGGTISGLVGTVELQNNGGDTLARSADGPFAFATAVGNGADFEVTVLTQPSNPNQTCVVANGSGKVSGANITGVTVTCTTNTYAVSGTISGLVGTVVLQNNGGDTLSRSTSGDFAFPTAVSDGAAYNVTVLTQPTGPNQTCVPTDNAGTINGANVTDVSIACTTNTYTIGGTISGLGAGKEVVLQINGGDTLPRSANGDFTFPAAVPDGTAYTVTVQTQPAGQVCSVANGTSTLGGANVSNVGVTCVTAYTIGGTISGLAGTGTVTLQNNGGDDLPRSSNGSFTFATAIVNGGAYNVTVLTQPTGPNQTCVPTGNTGTVTGANVTDVSITCTTNTYTVGGTVSGLGAGKEVVLQNNGGDSLTIAANGSFTFAVEILDGTGYAVTVQTQPAGQICSVSGGNGTLGGTDVTDVAVTCINSYAVGGTVSGLIGTVHLQNNGGDDLAISANGDFAFATAIADGTGYSVSVLTQPAGQICAVSNPAGVVSGAAVTNILVSCAPVLNLELAGIKTFRFTWADTDGETEYRLLENPDGSSGYSQIDTIAAGAVNHEIEVFLPGRVNARYILQACNGADCVDSAPVLVSGTLEAAVGYVKAFNTNAFDNFGLALALSADGATLAVGAPHEDSAATGIDGNEADNSRPSAGAVYVFAKSGGAWSRQAYLKASNTKSLDLFGYALALSGDGDTLAVGSPGEGSAATGVDGNEVYDCIAGVPVNCAAGSGAVYVFTRTAGDWTQQAYVKASNTGTEDGFGIALALSADGATLAVGATAEDSAATGIGGTQVEDCTANVNTNCAPNSGAAYVFTRSGVNWSQQAYVKASNRPVAVVEPDGTIDPGNGENFGNALALSEDGNTLAVGAWHESGEVTGINQTPTLYNKAFSGAVYVFTRAGTTWSQEAYVKALSTDPEDHFGYAVALAADGNTLAVGADGEDSDATGVNGTDAELSNQGQLAGAAYVFTRSGTDWSQQAYIKASNTDSNTFARDFFGKAVALSSDGDTLAVGAPGEDSASVGINGDQADNSAADAGAVYVFTRAGGSWSQQAYVKASNTAASDGFGSALALAGDGATLAVGAASEDSAATGIGGDQADDTASAAGAVYLY